ncbi:MAG: hypothetical protein EXS67_05065 [Candidatus Margulisbacteria bacterium]|nr:hypothetical protein [Candidatus Margulisiibacteriota bacterium]
MLQKQKVAQILDPATYNVVLEKVKSDGTVSQLSTSTSIADSNGKISYSFTNVPTLPHNWPEDIQAG